VRTDDGSSVWQAERQNAEDVQLALICSKQKYRMALISLEAISDEVHMQRRLRHEHLELPLRTPGVGAEHELDLDDELSDMPSATLGLCSLISEINSCASSTGCIGEARTLSSS